MVFFLKLETWRHEFSLHESYESHLLQAAILGYPATWLQSFVAIMILAMECNGQFLRDSPGAHQQDPRWPENSWPCCTALGVLQAGFCLSSWKIVGIICLILPNGIARIAGCGEYGHRTSGVCDMPSQVRDLTSATLEGDKAPFGTGQA